MKYRLFIVLALLSMVGTSGCMLAGATATAVTTPATIAPTPTRKPLPDSDTTPEANTPQVGARKGDLAPDFTLDSLDGAPISLGQFRGQAVLINFWAVWCTYCRVEMPDIQHVYEAYQDRGFVVLGINVGENEQSAEPFVKDAGVTFPILMDRDALVMRTYRMRGLPSSVLIDSEGVIRTIHIGLIEEAQLAGYLEQIGVEP